MNIHTVRRMTSSARDRGSRPRVHGNGFIQLDLNDTFRLHVWGHPEIPRQVVPTPIHDHPYSFTSHVIDGQLIHRHIELAADNLGAYQAYQAIPTHDADTRLEMLKNKRFHATIVEESLLRAGDIYSFGAGLFHETLAPWHCVTVIEKGEKISVGGYPLVLVPFGHEPDNNFDRYTVAPSPTLWKIIYQGLNRAADG